MRSVSIGQKQITRIRERSELKLRNVILQTNALLSCSQCTKKLCPKKYDSEKGNIDQREAEDDTEPILSYCFIRHHVVMMTTTMNNYILKAALLVVQFHICFK